MGDETTEFASRFSSAVRFLGELARRRGRAVPALPGELKAAVRGALDAVEAVYATDTGAVRRWPEQRRRVLAAIAGVRAALEATGVGEDVRRGASALVGLLDPGAAGGGPDGGGRGTRSERG